MAWATSAKRSVPGWPGSELWLRSRRLREILVLAAIQAQWRPLQMELFPRLMLLDFSDPELLIGQTFRRGRPDPEIWSASLPARTCRQGVPVAFDALGDFIGDLLLEHSAPDAPAVVALPRPVSHWRLLEWPDGLEPEDPVEALREREIPLGWPFSLEQAALAIQPLEQSPGASLVVGTSLQSLNAWIETFAISGTALRHLIPSQACVHMALQSLLDRSEPDVLVALLQPLADGVDLLIWRDGVPEFEQRLPADPEAMLQALLQVVDFCRSQLGDGPLRLLQAEPLQQASVLEERLDLPVELVDRGEYGSLHLAGLGELLLVR